MLISSLLTYRTLFWTLFWMAWAASTSAEWDFWFSSYSSTQHRPHHNPIKTSSAGIGYKNKGLVTAVLNPFGVRHALYFYGMMRRRFVWVFGLSNDLRQPTVEEISVLSFRQSSYQYTDAEGLESCLVRMDEGPGIGCTRQQAPPQIALHAPRTGHTRHLMVLVVHNCLDIGKDLNPSLHRWHLTLRHW